MSSTKRNNMIRWIVDVVMTILLLCLMAYQVTGEMAHEYNGIAMTSIVIVHQILNRKWYSALFKGKYNPFRRVSTILNVLLLLSIAVTAFCGMSMSTYAVPFLYGMAPVFLVRRVHLSMSHWAFVLMGLHLGMHIPAMTAAMQLKDRTKTFLNGILFCLSGIGFWLFLRNRMPDYLLFRVPFAFLDYEKAGWQVFLENLVMLLGWAFIGMQTAYICRSAQKTEMKKNRFISAAAMAASALIGIVLAFLFPPAEGYMAFDESDWSMPQAETSQNEVQPDAQTTGQTDDTSEGQESISIDDQFEYIQGGSFLMGSPDTENWRIDDEVQHEVSVGSFYMDPYETTQSEYVRLMGSDPSTFSGDDLPVENISWLEAVQFANAKSTDAGLTPVYAITENGVTWDLSADGYRLPTEAEWEYACRAGTVTPFNTERSLSADEANFYGHYPYEIEENYFNNSVLEARPGEYRQTTITVGSFEPNAWGLYDMHGNVNEWCWDFYGAYDMDAAEDPVGPASGTRHVYRGGGWNDFAKNMRSAYRAAGQEDLHSYNLGVRLVRNAGSRSGSVMAGGSDLHAETGGKILIAYFSWGGNTRGIAGQIQAQTGADLFEITPAEPYSTDYNTVLMEAQADQHDQARPELSEHVRNMDEYDTILLGYPNWWASIPMPIASFLEEYDFSGKTIIPFCSHGGGRFGQSLTAIAKLAPDSVIGKGLSVHYKGGSGLPDDITDWLKENGINEKQ
ncbi:MAG: SUMF1/EgtB/PvdO family nonheme iron enzyme [Solobacterium sp.]|nr:SUMF1/EgtB/PvdO family nonheme iron enzyme [Solobacterium sp.]